MIKFFRHLRQNLISEGKTGKYVKYAVGETILVVIGILIALQINNWNETRKSRRMANDVYANLLTSLVQDSIEVERTINLLTTSLKIQKKLIQSDSNTYGNATTQKDLDMLVEDIFSGVMSFFPKTGVYELITSNNNMDLLESKEIKSLLINLYDFQYKRYENVDAIIDHKYHYQIGSVIRKKIKFLAESNSESELIMIRHVDPILFNEHFDELVSECMDVYGVLSTANNYLIEIQESIDLLTGLIRKELNRP